MTTKVQICSAALVKIGDSPIDSFGDSGDGATAASALWGSTLNEVLSSHRWNFATHLATLSNTGTDPLDTDYSYEFDLPDDIILMVRIVNDVNYRLVGKTIYANTSTIVIEYIREVDESYFTPMFVKAMEERMAAELAIPVADSTSKAEQRMKIYETMLKKARFQDSQGQPGVAIQHSPFVEARR